MTTFLSNVFNIDVVDLPAWFAGQSDFSWFQPPNADGLVTSVDPRLPNQGGPNPNGSFSITPPASSQRDLTHPWCGATAREDWYGFFFSGGHKASYDNSVYQYGPFSSSNPQWSRPMDPDHNIPERAQGQAWEASGQPACRHGYYQDTWIPALGTSPERGRRWFTPHCDAPAGDTTGPKHDTQSVFFTSDNSDACTYDPEGYNENLEDIQTLQGGENGAAAWDSATQRVYVIDQFGVGWRFFSYDPVTRLWAGPHATGLPKARGGGAIDPVRQIFMTQEKDTLTGPVVNITVYDLEPTRLGQFVQPNTSGLNNVNGQTEKPSCEFEPRGEKFVWFDSHADGRLVVCEPPSNYRNANGTLNASATWSFSNISMSGSPESPDTSGQAYNGTFTKFRYIKSLGCFAIVVNGDGNGIWVGKIPQAGL